MYVVLGIILNIILCLYCNNKILNIRLKDFEEEDKLLEANGMPVINVKSEEMRINKGFLSDNYLAIIISSILSVLFIFIKGNSIYSAFFMGIIPVLVSMFFIDIRMKRIPNCLVYSIYLLSAIYIVYSVFINRNISMFYGNILNSFILTLLYFLIAVVTGGALGGGDIKLISSVSLLFPFSTFGQFLMYPFIIGGMQGLYLLIFKRKKLNDYFAFAPAIIIGMLIIAFLF